MTEPTPLVSVVTATRNRPDLLRRALSSIQLQALEQYEVIVVDDGSRTDVQDQYDEIWRSLDRRFVLVRLSPPDGPGSGPGAGRNRGIELARGAFVAFLDHDDFWVRSDHLSVGVEALTEADADYFFSNVRGERDGPVEFNWAAPYLALVRASALEGRPSVFTVPLALFLKVMRRGMVHPSQTIARRSLLAAVGGFARELRAAFDVNLMFRLADRAQRILYRPEVAVAVSLPDAASYTAAIGPSAAQLGMYEALQHARLHCHRYEVRACIRNRQGWMLREFATARLSAGQSWEAVRLNCEAVAVYPTAGAVLAAFRAIGEALRRPSRRAKVARRSSSDDGRRED